jgi:hypothetical protein
MEKLRTEMAHKRPASRRYDQSKRLGVSFNLGNHRSQRIEKRHTIQIVKVCQRFIQNESPSFPASASEKNGKGKVLPLTLTHFYSR